MQSMRDVLRGTLGRSLGRLSAEDRLVAAWPVACGSALAARAEIAGYDDGVVTVRVQSRAWLEQFESMRAMLASEMTRIARVQVSTIHYEVSR